MSNIPANPNFANSVTSGTDTSIVDSTTGGGASYWNGAGQTLQVLSNSHPVVSRGDGALWDTTSGAYVAIQLTTAGTTSFPKNGQ